MAGKMFSEAEIAVLKSVTDYGKPGSLTEEEIEILTTANENLGIAPIPLGVLRKAKAVLAGVQIQPVLKEADTSLVKMKEFRRLVQLFAYSSEIDVMQDAVERVSVTLYMVYKALNKKGLLTIEDVVEAAVAEEKDFDAMLEAERKIKEAEENG